MYTHTQHALMIIIVEMLKLAEKLGEKLNEKQKVKSAKEQERDISKHNGDVRADEINLKQRSFCFCAKRDETKIPFSHLRKSTCACYRLPHFQEPSFRLLEMKLWKLPST